MLATPTAEPTLLPDDPTDQIVGESADLLEAFLEAIPRIGLALVTLIVLILVAIVVRKVLRTRLTKARNESFGRVFSKLAFGLIVSTAVVFSITIVFPSVQPVDLIAGLGVFSIAIGFAFQDILSNLLAGILLLIRQPFEIGDQIEVSGHTGEVKMITIRETQLRTFDGQKIIVPNAEVYQQTLRVQTAYGPRRTVIAIGLDDHEDQDAATDVILDAIRSIDGVQADPAPQVYFTGYGDSTTDLEVRYWTAPEQAEVRRVQDKVVRAISRNLKDSGISMPSPIRELDARVSFDETINKNR